MLVCWKGGEKVFGFSYDHEQLWDDHHDRCMLTYRNEKGTEKKVLALPDSLLYDLRTIGRILSVELYWKEHDTVWFVLTGTPPRIAPVELATRMVDPEYYTHKRIELRMASYISPETVLRIYTSEKQRLRIALPKKIHPFGEKNKTLFKFVLNERRHDPEVSWRELMMKWNETQRAEWTYKSPRQMHRDYYQRVLFKLLEGIEGEPQKKRPEKRRTPRFVPVVWEIPDREGEGCDIIEDPEALESLLD